MEKISFKSIKARLNFWFFIMALGPLFIGFLITYNQQKHSIEQETFAKLVAIRELKVEQVNLWLSERISNLQSISKDFEIRGLDNILGKSSKTPEELKKIEIARKLLDRYSKIYTIHGEIKIVDPKTGLVKLSENRKFEQTNMSHDLAFSMPLKTGNIYIKEVYYSKEQRNPTLTISIPIYCLSHETDIIGILIAKINIEKSLHLLLANKIGLGETGETLIVNSSAIALNELRNYANAPFKLKIKAKPAMAASAGQTGIIKTKDYRGQEVLAAYTYIPQLKWGFVCKQDMHELNAPVRALVKNMIILFIISAIMTILVTLWIIKRISKPIINIDIAAQKIKRGDYSVRAKVNSSDELSSLANSINEMTTSIETRINAQNEIGYIAEIMINQVSMQGFCSKLLKQLMSITQANMSAFYVLNEVTAQYEHFTSIGANEKLLKPFNAKYPAGEVGNALSSKKIYYLRDIPENTIFSYLTIAGNAIPKEIITIPILVENSVVAIISLVNMHKFSEECYDILKQSWVGINTAYSNLMASERTRILAEQLSLINQQLDVQTQELQYSSSELQDQNIELEIQRKEIEKANQLKSEFLSNMSHELRTPLNSIMALSRVLIMQAKDKLNDEENNYLEIVERNGKELLRLINDILDLAKIESGKEELAPTNISPGLMLNVIKENLEPLANEKGVTINLQVTEEIPDVETDTIKLHQVLSNIISNAVKFTETGEVTLSVKSDSVNIYFEVEDTGIGIPNDNLPYIFDEFRQVDGSASRKYEGTGLGLAIAYKIIKLLGGDIEVKSTLDKGSLFTITLPIKWQNQIIDSKHSKVKTALPPASEKTILVVDDNPAIIKEISKHLTEAGYIPISTTSGLKAIELAEQHQPFAITLDIVMPNIDGWEVLMKIKNNPKTKHIPVIIVSIVDESATGFALGADGYIKKPLNNKLLISEIRKLYHPPQTVMVGDNNKLDRENMRKKKKISATDLPKVLIIEDNPDNMTTIRAILKGKFNIFESEDGESGLQQAIDILPDIILLDMTLPKKDGIEVVKILKNNATTLAIPVIAVTARTMKDDKEIFLKAGCDDFLAKPVEPKMLLLKLNEWLSGDQDAEPQVNK